MTQRYYVEKFDGYLNEVTLEYDGHRWCVMEDEMVIAECYNKVNARDIVRMLNFSDKIINATKKLEK